MSEDLCTKCIHERRFHEPNLLTRHISGCTKCDCDGFYSVVPTIDQISNPVSLTMDQISNSILPKKIGVLFGAGASTGVGLPSSADLIDKINFTNNSNGMLIKKSAPTAVNTSAPSRASPNACPNSFVDAAGAVMPRIRPGTDSPFTSP